MGAYTSNQALMARYNADQRKYATQVRESDRVLLNLIADAAPASLLDIGCSTGNLLLHVRRLFPAIRLTGGDMVRSSLDEALAAGLNVRQMDMEAIDGKYDCVVASAVACCFGWSQYLRALDSVVGALKPGGTYLAFEWLHPHQDVHVVEANDLDAPGLPIYFRNYDRVRQAFAERGMTVQFKPFSMPFDLPETSDRTSHTKQLATGERLCFRGGLFQPWCHMVAKKPRTIS